MLQVVDFELVQAKLEFPTGCVQKTYFKTYLFGVGLSCICFLLISGSRRVPER